MSIKIQFAGRVFLFFKNIALLLNYFIALLHAIAFNVARNSRNENFVKSIFDQDKTSSYI